jgi:hypothetical protein
MGNFPCIEAFYEEGLSFGYGLIIRQRGQAHGEVDGQTDHGEDVRPQTKKRNRSQLLIIAVKV